MEFRYEGIDSAFVLRVGESEVAAILVEVSCYRAADAAQSMSMASGRCGVPYPPEAPVTSASLPFSSLSTATDMASAGTDCRCLEVCVSLSAIVLASFALRDATWGCRSTSPHDLDRVLIPRAVTDGYRDVAYC